MEGMTAGFLRVWLKFWPWFLLAILCLAVGFYPILYLQGDGRVGLFQTKDPSLLADPRWRLAFYAHIGCGGLALLVGWSLFIRAWRLQYPGLHRNLGKLYVLMVCLSGAAGIYLALHASTGWVAGLGFACLGLVWLIVTIMAYQSARGRDFPRHECLMVYSFSATFAAVTLRFWLPLLLGLFRLDFSVAYPLVAWLCWVPNLLVARWIVSRF